MGKGQERYLRNNSTTPEVLLWNPLKHDQIGFQFRRQYGLATFILDFYCPSVKLAIEIDGRVHDLKENSDEDRDAYLASEYVTVKRFPARAVYRDSYAVAMQIKEVCERLQRGEHPFEEE